MHPSLIKWKKEDQLKSLSKPLSDLANDPGSNGLILTIFSSSILMIRKRMMINLGRLP